MKAALPITALRHHSFKRLPHGLTLLEVVISLSILVILATLILVKLQQSREQARCSMCKGHLKQIGLALHNYHDTWGVLPPMMSGNLDTGQQFGWRLNIQPYIESSSLYDNITTYERTHGLPPPSEDWSSFARGNMVMPVYLCPSDTINELYANGPVNYRVCVGDVAFKNNSPGNRRGLFGYESAVSFSEVTDGLANTILAGEMVQGINRSRRVLDGAVRLPGTDLADAAVSVCISLPKNHLFASTIPDEDILAPPPAHCKGCRIWEGRRYYAAISTTVPPNGPVCSATNDSGGWTHVTPSSRHKGGVQVVMADGAVRFISENINAGTPSDTVTLTTSGASPYGVWGALGTMNGGEVIGEY